MSRTKRGGWPYGNPPNTQFTVNTQSPQSQGLVGWWPTLGSRGNALRDYVRNLNESFPGGAANPTYATIGQHGTVLSYDGGDHVSLAYVARPTDMTVCAWVATSAAGSIQDLFAWGAAGETAEFRMTAANQLEYLQYDLATFPSVVSAGTINDGKFHCVVVSKLGTAAQLYIDGVADGSNTVNNNPEVDNLNIGALNQGGYKKWWSGKIGDVRLYNRALSAGQVWALYNPATRWELYAPVISMGAAYVAAAGGLPIFSSAGIHSTLFGGQVIR